MMYSNTGNVSSHHLPSPTTAATAAVTPSNAAIPHHLLHHHHHHQVYRPIMIPLPPSPSVLPYSASASGGGGGGADDDDFPMRDERFPQWSNQETRDFIEIRAQLEFDFTTAKRNKSLWEMVANRMREKGYRRTPDQCKCKWKNLVNRYKGQEASDVDNGRRCPFFDELHAVFTARAYRMQPPQLNAETVVPKARKTLTNASEDQSHEEFSQEQENDEEIEVNQAGKARAVPKRKVGREKRQKIAEMENHTTNVNKNDSVLNALQEMMRNFIQQQQRIDMHWRESMEKHAEEREMFEDEWRKKMEKLERERLVMENAWREREEQRRLREESRAQKRDALLTTLLNKLVRDENNP